MYGALQVGGRTRPAAVDIIFCVYSAFVYRPPACLPARPPACLPACPAFVLISCLSTGIDKEVSLPILTPLLLAPACDACLPPLQTELRINFSAILQKMNINPHTLGGGSRLKLLKLSKRSSS